MYFFNYKSYKNLYTDQIVDENLTPELRRAFSVAYTLGCQTLRMKCLSVL